MALPEKILIVDDDADVRGAFRQALMHAGFHVSECEDGQAALEHERAEQPALIILDIEMPRMDGRKTLAELRRRGCTRPVLMVTHVDDVAARVDGLNSGADDYIGKPCTPAELIARVRAVLRRHGRADAMKTTLHFDQVIVDLDRKTATNAGTVLRLTRTEFALLMILREHVGKPVSRELIVERVWHGKMGNSHALDTHLWRLRRKLGDSSGKPRWICNHAGVGYTMAPEVVRGG